MNSHTRQLAASLCASLALGLWVVVGVRSQNDAVRRITNTPERTLNLNPTISGDGQHIAFESNANLTTTSVAGFHTLRADLTGNSAAFTQIAASRAPAPAISRDGSRLAFASRENLTGENPDGNSEIFLFADGKLRQVTNTSPHDATLRIADGNFQPSISNDGQLVAFASNRDLTGANADANLEVFIYDSTTRITTQITDTTNIIGSSDAKLSGDGARVAFIRDDGAAGDDVSNARDLMLFERAANSMLTIAKDVDGLALTYGRATSDDGQRVVYAAQTAARTTQVFLYDGRNAQTRRITSLGSRAADVPLHPTISGDGSRIAFATRRNVTGGNSDASVELYVYDLPSDKITRVTGAPAAATAEVVSSLNEDGSLVAFNFPRVHDETVSDSEFANNSEIYLARLEARAPFSTNLQIINGASFGKEPANPKSIARGQIAVATGINLALGATRAARLPDGTFPRKLGGATLQVNGRDAQLFYASPTQINFVVPDETETGTAQVVLRNHDGQESRASVAVVNAAPGVFTEKGDGSGVCIALDADTLLRSPFDPVDAANGLRRLTIFSTGVRHAKDVTVNVGGRELTVESVLPSPDLPGLDEIHVLLTRSLAGAGVVPLVVRADGRASNQTTITFTGTRRAARLSLEPSAASIGVGRSLRFVATVRDEDGVEITNAPVSFASSDESVAPVDTDGLARGLRAGTATIKATSGAVSATAQLTVFPLSLVINEILADPPDGAAGDANHDGARSSTQDEFIEIVNASTVDLDIGGYQLTVRASSGADTVRHIFAAHTIVAPGTAIVVFGGAQAATFDSANPAFAGALVVMASTGGLSLTNGGSTVKLLDPSGAVIEQLTYGGATDADGDRNQSLTRAPDITGDFALHQTAPQSGGRVFSPGTRIDGAPFSLTVPIARIEVAPASASIERGARQQFTARAFDANENEIHGIIFRWQSSDALVATIDDNGLAQSIATGDTQITAHARGMRSAPAMLRVLQPQPKVARVEVTPAAASINRGGTIQFNAQAFDFNNQPVSDASFTWSSSNASIATVDAAGLARGTGIGAATITATTSDGAGGVVANGASLEIRVPLVINEIFADVPPDDSSTVAVEGDANRDGARSSDDDEFVELVNYSRATVDISGMTVSDATSKRFTFPAGTLLAAGRAVVIFGGGAPPRDDPAFGGAQIFNAASLGLNDAGDTVTLKLPVGDVEIAFASQSYGTGAASAPPAPSDQSLTRSPDAGLDSTGGDFTAHTQATNAATRAFSPGTRADGTPFASPPISRISILPTSAAIEIGASQSFDARAYALLDGVEFEVPNVSFIWDSSDAGKASVAPTTGASTTARAASAGSTQIRARAGGRDATATLTVNPPPPPPVARIEVAPPSATIGVGASQQFTAKAFDANGQELSGVTFTWTTSNANVAAIDANGLATGKAAGTCEVRATSANTTSAPAMLTVTPPRAPSAGEVIINEALVAFASSTTQTRRDFVELFNTTNQTLDITGLVLTFRPSGSANAPQSVMIANASGTRFLIQPRGYFLIANGADTFGVQADFDAGDFDLNNTTGGIKIELSGAKLDGLAYQGGSAPPAAPFNAFGEGAILVFTSGTTNDLIRSPNAVDTNNNATDFRRNGTISSVSPKAANP
ncbi:MAG TPA: Ig-like domain-containing protein [Pyrinomonadaceae bacterium]|nr:Ig-like domain-containing protein [Pyrinomonadaceae bacterium]